MKAMCDAILEKSADTDNEMLISLIEEGFISSKNGNLSAAFPVFSAETLSDTIWPLLKPLAEDICQSMIEICDIAAQILKDFIPRALRDKTEQLAFIHHQLDVMAFIIETMVKEKRLALPENNEKPCVFGVIK